MFAVIADTDAEKLRRLGYADGAATLSDADVEKMVEASGRMRASAVTSRRRIVSAKQLADRGIILEDSTGWKCPLETQMKHANQTFSQAISRGSPLRPTYVPTSTASTK